MRPSTREPLLLSKLAPQNINLRDGEPRTILCPDCQTWHRLERKIVKPHHLDRTGRGAAGAAPRCKGSLRRVTFDLSIEEWGERLLRAEETVTGRRAQGGTRRKPLPVAPTAISRLAHTTDGLRNGLRAHRASCQVCRIGVPCDHAINLAGRINAQAQSAVPSLPGSPLAGPATALDRTERALAAHRHTCRACRTGRPCTTGQNLTAHQATISRTAADLRQTRSRQSRQAETVEQQQTLRAARNQALQWKQAAAVKPTTSADSGTNGSAALAGRPADGPDLVTDAVRREQKARRELLAAIEAENRREAAGMSAGDRVTCLEHQTWTKNCMNQHQS
ncbi:hypothetical protein ACFWHQ_34890 [Streptomyces sp. NPDC060334]|uniref:hypothetical protein n=1 Tax=Streptomyces sp. NPDC060334 TaxID=3347099 RepID=UPI0036536B80